MLEALTKTMDAWSCDYNFPSARSDRILVKVLRVVYSNFRKWYFQNTQNRPGWRSDVNTYLKKKMLRWCQNQVLLDQLLVHARKGLRLYGRKEPSILF